LPKKSCVTDYSYRTTRCHQEQLLSGWVSQLSPILFPQPQAFCLDFHPIPYRGDASGLDNHYVSMRGFEKAKPKQLYSKFVETGGVVTVLPDRILVRFDKRSHNPILREAALDQQAPPIPWLGNLPLTFEYP